MKKKKEIIWEDNTLDDDEFKELFSDVDENSEGIMANDAEVIFQREKL